MGFIKFQKVDITFNYRSTAKQVKLSVDDLFARSEDDIIKQWQSFNKEFREEFCNLLAQTHLDKKLISQKAEVVSKAYVACVLDYRSSVVRHAIFAMDVFTQVPRDVVNKERIYSEISRLKVSDGNSFVVLTRN